MRVLLTRPEQDASPFADHLRQAGVDAVIAPMMTIEYRDGSSPDLSGVQAVLVTSANGVRAFVQGSTERDIAVFAVGDATAREARAAGFSTVRSAGGDVDDLAALVCDSCDPSAGVLLHVAGSAVAGDLAGMLEESGFTYRREIMYSVAVADGLPPAAEAALDGGSIDGVALFSPRSAEVFEACIAAAGRKPALGRLRAFALSQNVAAALSTDSWCDVLIADEPTAAAMLKMVLEAAETR